MAKIRLHQFLSRTGKFASKSDLIRAVRNKEMEVDGKIVTDLHHQMHLSADVRWKGAKLTPLADKIYLLCNKPAGYLCSRLSNKDKELGKKSVFFLVKGFSVEQMQTLVCVGRLDEDTSGLLIITNDGAFAHKIAHPSSAVEKIYDAGLRDELNAGKITLLERGVEIILESDGRRVKHQTLPCKIEMLGKRRLHITLTEGKKREVKLMFEAAGNEVIRLQRAAVGGLRLSELNLKEGACMPVSREFILQKIASP